MNVRVGEVAGSSVGTDIVRKGLGYGVACEIEEEECRQGLMHAY